MTVTDINNIPYFEFAHILIPDDVWFCILKHPNGRWYDLNEGVKAMDNVKTTSDFIREVYEPLSHRLRDKVSTLPKVPYQARCLMLAYRDKQNYDCPYWQYKIETAPNIIQWFDEAVAYFQSLVLSDTKYYQMLVDQSNNQ